VPVNRDGTFTVNANSAHLYEIRVVTSHGTQIYSEHTQFRQGQPLELRLPKSNTSAPAPGGPISALRLSHKPAKAARRLLQQAETLAGEGNLAASADRLQEALAADPNWFEAWNNLGSRRLTLGQNAEAADAFRHALAIDSKSAIVHSNLGLAQLFLRQPLEAEESARRALQLDPAMVRASYVMGMALLQQNKRQDEALAELKTASATLPHARLAIAEWQCRHNEFGPCETELKAYLKTPRTANHAVAERWLGILHKQQKRP
jgi:tetratricopeptide (TPR) repeat protein